MTDDQETTFNRRGFLAAAAAFTGACALNCPLARGADEDDDDDGDVVAKVPAGPIDIGPVGDFSKEGAYDKWIKPRHMIVVRAGARLYALTAICTHKQALIKADNKQFLLCPKHKSRFNLDGQPVPKPNGKIGLAKKPLTHFAISIDAQKHVIVDTSKPVAADAGNAFVKIL
ncbi:MAG TPA: Rieske 2Fe-2S domain-containing protein [Tepidisphaeraceae bacterium]|nr:Rieske 2Fe-2S domain-containing protein [Tepidisphaeraceae bacterium]